MNTLVNILTFFKNFFLIKKYLRNRDVLYRYIRNICIYTYVYIAWNFVDILFIGYKKRDQLFNLIKKEKCSCKKYTKFKGKKHDSKT